MRLPTAVIQATPSGLVMRYGHVLRVGGGQEMNHVVFVSQHEKLIRKKKRVRDTFVHDSIGDEITCPDLMDPANGTVDFETSIGAVAMYTCDEGLDLIGDDTRTCQASGEWSGEPPTCSVTCVNLTDPQNGAVDQDGNLPGDTARYTCNSGYNISGNEIRICLEDGNWSGDEPVCNCKLLCNESIG